VSLDMSCAFATSMQSHEHARCAEELGFQRAYFYDSPALYPDVWAQLCRAADLTERIVLGPAVLVPSNRHVMTNAAAIATLAAIAGPDRVSVAVGSGRTARLGMGKRPLNWADVADYIRALRGLLRGEVVDWDGSRIKMLHAEEFGAARPLEIEILIAAVGPKGLAVARELGDGAFGARVPVAGFARSPCLVWGTILGPGEDPNSDRVLASAGPPAGVFAGHYPIEFGDPADDTETGASWRAAYKDVPPEELHLAVHEGHLTSVNEFDRPFVTGDLVVEQKLALSRDGWLAKIADLESGGASEIVFQPAGPDFPGQLAAFSQLFAQRS